MKSQFDLLVMVFVLVLCRQNLDGQTVFCSSILEDLSPTSNDLIVDVNVNFWVFTPTNVAAHSVWTDGPNPTSYSSAVKCLEDANKYCYTVTTSPMLSAGSVANNPRIRLVLKTFSIVPHNSAYYYPVSTAMGYADFGFRFMTLMRSIYLLVLKR